MKIYINEKGPEDSDKVLDLFTRYEYMNDDESVPYSIDMRNKGTELILEYKPDESTQSQIIMVSLDDGWEVIDLTEFNSTYFSDSHAVGDHVEDDHVEEMVSDMIEPEGDGENGNGRSKKHQRD